VQQLATAHPYHSAPAISDGDLRSLIESLIDAQRNGARLAKRVMVLQELADVAQSVACAAYDKALDAVDDSDAVDRAVMMASAASRVSEDELYATIAWKEHLRYADDLVDGARQLLEAL
jgi:hypothetical protein